jgi:hypothetical protein
MNNYLQDYVCIAAINVLCQFYISFSNIKTPKGRVGKWWNSITLLTACPLKSIFVIMYVVRITVF